MSLASHERPILLVFPENTAPASLLPALLAAPELAQVVLPAPWFLDPAGVDLVSALPDVRAVDLSNLERVLRVALALSDSACLQARVASSWRDVHEQVRQHYLGRGVAGTFAHIFKLGRSSQTVEPPPAFVQQCIHEHAFTVQYRLRAPNAAFDPQHPPQEGSVMLYVFDPDNAGAREEYGLPGKGPVLEVFCYAQARAQHRDAWARIVAPLRGRVVDQDPAPNR